MSSNQFELADSPSDVISAVRFSSKSPNRLLVASWDKGVYLYEIEEGNGKLLKRYEHRAPVLDVCFGKDDEVAYSVGLDWDVRRIDLQTGEQTVLSSHKAGVKSVVYAANLDLLISGSWDCTLHVHNLDQPTHTPATVPLPSKPFSMSLSPTKLVVAMASRNVYVYDTKGLQLLASQSHSTRNTDENILEVEPFQKRESSMKFMTRCVACTPNDLGYATSSIEGRIAVDWFDEAEEVQMKKYAFKAHRQTENDVDIVYPVNALAFHPIHQLTFASGGGDGAVSLWDGIGKRRIRQYQKFPASVAALGFSADGRYLAVAVSPGFEDGKEHFDGIVKVFIRELGENEAKSKGAK